jgi:NADH-quinone oxidoreductase subunit L
MFRALFLAFHGEPRDHKIHAHESPKVMLVPLVILAALAVVLGVLLLGQKPKKV